MEPRKLAASLAWALLLAAAPTAAEPVNEGIFAPDRLRSVLGQDGVTSIPVKFKDGTESYLWTFGDTILGGWKGAVVTTATVDFNSAADMKSMPSNTLALTPVPSSSNYRNLPFAYYGSSGAPREFIACREGETPQVNRFWADDGIQVGGNLYVYYMDIKLDKDIAGGFSFTGTGLVKSPVPAKADLNSFSFERVAGFHAKSVVIGDSALAKDGYVYLLGRGSKKDDEKLGGLVLLRVKPSSIEDISSYEYLSYDGKWGDRKRKGLFFDDVNGEASLAYDAVKKVLRIAYMSFYEQAIMTAEFSDFAGLAKAPKAAALYRPPAKKDAPYYSAKEVFSDPANVYFIYIDPTIYQPILVRAPRK